MDVSQPSGHIDIRQLLERVSALPPEERADVLDAVSDHAPQVRSQLDLLLMFDARSEHLYEACGEDMPGSHSRWEKLSRLSALLRGQPAEELAHALSSMGIQEPSQVVRLSRIVESEPVEEEGASEKDSGHSSAPGAPRTFEVSSVPRRVGRYQLLDRLGEGGMGVVYKALDPDLDRFVALKFLPPHLQVDSDFRARFEQEARTASALDHPHIGYIHEIGETGDGRRFIAMAFYEGETLEEKLERGPLPDDEAVRLMRQLASALSCAHEAGIVHRDVKPSNVIVTPEGMAKLVDFGLAKAQDAGLTQPGTRLGSTAYASPEQLRGEQVDQRADIWAFGVLGYQMLTGERPFAGDYDAAVLYSVLNTDPVPIRERCQDVSSRVAEVIERCLRKERSERYPTMVDIQTALGQQREMPTSSEAFSWLQLVQSAQRFTWTNRLIALGGIMLFAILLATWQTGNTLPEDRHLAVLPFEVVGEAHDAQLFSAGLLQTLTSRLTQLEQFDGPVWVVPASEIEDGMTISHVRQQFGVTLVVSGSVQVEADRVRLTLNLVDAQSRRQLGSEQIDSQVGSALALQDAAALALTRMIRLPLQPAEREFLTAGSSRELEANAVYLRGWGHLRDHTSGDELDRAIDLFKAAVAIDPNFALAYAGLGEAYWKKYQATEDVMLAEEAIASSQQALALNNTLAPVHVVLGIIHTGRAQYDKALASLHRALEIDPRNAEAHRRIAGVYSRLGRTEEAEREYMQAIGLKPGYWRGYNSLGIFYLQQGRSEEALAQYERGLELAPANQSLLNNSGAALWQLGRLSAAAEMFERILQVNPDQVRVQSNLATLYFYDGRYEEASHFYEQESVRRPNDHMVQGNLGDSYYWLGDHAAAAEAYQHALYLLKPHLELRGADPDLLGALATYHARLGEADSARAYLGRIETLLTPQDAHVQTAFGIGEVYESLGEREDALRWMTAALERGYGWMQVQHSPWLTSLREDPVIASLPNQLQ